MSTYPNTTLIGKHRLVGWGDFETLEQALHQRIFSYMVRATEGVVKEYHGDLFIDAETVRTEVKGETNFLYLVRHSGTNMGPTARLMFESLHYDAALYHFALTVDDRQEWWLQIDLIEQRPHRFC